jgi:hypothetical protein
MEEIETRRNEILYRRDGAGLAPELSRPKGNHDLFDIQLLPAAKHACRSLSWQS